MLGFRVYFIVVALLIGYRNIIVDPTPEGLFVSANTLIAVLITMAHWFGRGAYRISPQLQISTIAMMMLVSALVIQVRNPTWPAVSFITAFPATMLILMLRGTLLAFAAHLIYCVVWTIIVLTVSALKPIAIIAVAIGLYPFPMLLMGFVAAALQTRERDSQQLQLAQRRLASRVNTRNELIEKTREELALPLTALERLSDQAQVSHLALIAQAREASQLIGDVLYDLRSDLHIKKEDLIVHYEPASIRTFVSNIRRRVQNALANSGIAFEIDRRQLLTDEYMLDIRQVRRALMSLIQHKALYAGSSKIVLSVSSQQASDDRHNMQFSLQFNGNLPDAVVSNYFDAGFCKAPTIRELDAINNDPYPFTLIATLMQRMGGTLHYSPGAGDANSAYELGLSAQPAGLNSTTGSRSQRSRPFSGLRIAVVDDDPLVARMVQAMLVKGGCEAVEMAPMRDALRVQQLSGRAIDLVIFDSSNVLIGIEQFTATIAADLEDCCFIAMHPVNMSSAPPTNANISATIHRPPTLEQLRSAISESGILVKKRENKR
jgi:signal transduction histidine kinase